MSKFFITSNVMHKVNLDSVVVISPSGQGTRCGARTRDRRAPVFLRQVRLSPGLAIELVTTIMMSIVFAPKHTALPSRPACDCDDHSRGSLH
ncbi:hypothetical protein PoB_000415600 [Plakobranchus ocellatus]|uniref:Uncharacterized protein n=1 Tax=Plakobranchus ocellatus TaxID=259542 RepID=A0AAV3Y5F7_9GAST|nr:hypothetical protein PoB_000415600 [Plakobranchus ocellatus]